MPAAAALPARAVLLDASARAVRHCVADAPLWVARKRITVLARGFQYSKTLKNLFLVLVLLLGPAPTSTTLN